MARLIDTSLNEDANLVAHYKCDAGALTTDSSGEGHTLTNNNGVAEVAGKYEGGASCGINNTNKSLSIADDLGIAGGPISIAGWIKGNKLIENGHNVWECFEQCDIGTHVSYEIYYQNEGTDPTTPYLQATRTKLGVAAQPSTAHSIEIGTSDLVHVGLSYDGATLRFYVNAVEIGTGTAASGNGTVSGADDFNIGKRGTGGASNFADLSFDEVLVFSRKLSDAEFLELYEDAARTSGPLPMFFRP